MVDCRQTNGQQPAEGKTFLDVLPSVCSRARKMLDSGRYIHPCVSRFLPHRADRLHRMRIVEQPNRYTGHGGVLCPTHEYGSAAMWTEEMAEHPAPVRGPVELPRLTLDQDVFVQPVGGFTERRTRPLLTGPAVASDNGDRGTWDFGPKLSALTRRSHGVLLSHFTTAETGLQLPGNFMPRTTQTRPFPPQLRFPNSGHSFTSVELPISCVRKRLGNV